ncbi:bifunctional endoribonuclease/protein kinase ire1 [Fusarium falciforme]|uniref:non-specific serine/threonine protein kinase n=1 Tax=Fusarium falciforme TaxID=195108 RepID=A0A9W8QUZ5_9HYPO|nr:bifunctional endoribonuclease/protein kinase ire1 [Fusarium falciforme]KAJ4199365.1 bifunctional endoribonuclease/protein kinase ire1 [Fusarium falciforme]KAJ4255654.1 bifunctional endoribonuclease/protein kinase ire1 [Fusarium falciforme]
MKMLRRPPGEGRRPSQQQKLLIAFAIILLPWIQLVDAQQQHRPAADPALQPLQRPGGSSQQLADDAAVHQWAATPIDAAEAAYETAENIKRASTLKDRSPQQNPSKRKNRKNEYQNIIIPDDASALATLAPAEAVRAPNPSRHLRPRSVPASGLASPQSARSLKDWEAEDFVLLATVDGDLYASDRRTGKERWHLEVDQPMVETTHHRADQSILDESFHPVDHYVWAVEPNRDGGIYMWIPDSNAGLVRTGFTMKKLVEELAPYADENPPVVYTGDKKTTMITLDAASGRVLKWFGSTGSHVNEAESCLRPNTLYGVDDEECSSTGTITLGRTEYTVGIQRRDGRPIATLKYSEWSPNNYDNDLYQQHQSSLDSKYITSQHDGKVYAFNYARSGKPEPMFSETFAAPVARVFDVCRPWDANIESNPDLIVLPQPPMPAQDEINARIRSNSIFLNQTRSGSWYAMSGRSYPLIVDAPIAQISSPDWLDIAPAWDTINQTRLSKALVGTHFLNSNKGSKQHLRSLPAGSPVAYEEPDTYEETDNDPRVPQADVTPDEPTIFKKVKSIPQKAVDSVIEFVSNPILIPIFLFTLFYKQSSLRRAYRQIRLKGLHNLQFGKDAISDDGDETQGSESESEGVVNRRGFVVREKVLEQLKKPEDEGKTQVKEKANVTPTPNPEHRKVPDLDKDLPSTPVADVDSTDGEATPRPLKHKAEPKVESPTKGSAKLDDPRDEAQASAANKTQNEQPDGNQNRPAPEKKKKAHRGRRGGVKHRKGGRAAEASQSRDDDPGPGTVEDAVKNAKKLGDRPSLEPDVMTVANDMQSVTGSIIRLGSIEVDMDEQLGTGSNGTLVFAGKYDGREVAVKRMLIQFFDIASQETKLLRESDDHPNVIRYYAQQSRDGFLYIALERCAASLADVVEKPNYFRDLAIAGGRDLPNILYQITNGISHLHELRIVHRDLKPQNILVNMAKDGKPRMLVSDFGLCKKLEGGQSSFGATTGRAAGTSGWRAPELLLDDDARGNVMNDLSTQSGSGSVLVGDGMMPNNRRATRAIDIFSLGLVFFYVLTNGSHPFDCGDRYMREVNIRKGNYNLNLLDSLGDFAFEAKDLIESMLQADPKMRPTAKDIMAHPFFWSPKKRLAFLCDVSDHFEKEPRDPPSPALAELERHASGVTKNDFLRLLPREFVDSLGKQRKYTGSRLLDLLRALRNKRNHYEDMPDTLKRSVGPLPDGYLSFWTTRFPMLLLVCWNVVYNVQWDDSDRFREYYEPAAL